MKIGLKRGTVALSAYSETWEHEYECEKKVLKHIFASTIIEIQHIGSTAIPGMMAKPIIDIAIKVESIDKMDSIIDLLLQQNYEERVGRLPGRQRVFAKSINNLVSHHLHIIEDGDADWDFKLKFKQVLLNKPILANEYAQLKLKLASQHQDDRLFYTNQKAGFIKEVLKMKL
jgi:GrpB-like predicted nucleotidyltransferase (UPF0157 family)